MLVDEAAREPHDVAKERRRNGSAPRQPAQGERDGVQVGPNQLMLSNERLLGAHPPPPVSTTVRCDPSHASFNAKSSSSAQASKSSVTA